MRNTEHPVTTGTRRAKGGLESHRRLGSSGGAGEDVAPSTAGGAANCVVRYAVADNLAASCQLFGGSDLLMVTAGGSITKGDRIASDSAHKAVVATGKAKVLGIAEHDATSGQTLSFTPYPVPQSSAAGAAMGAAALTITGAADSTGVFAAWSNDTGVALWAMAVLNPSAASTGAATLDIGTAADATTASDNLFDGFDANAASASVNYPSGTGTNAKSWNLVPIGGAITVQEKTGDIAAFAGVLSILYFPVPS